jgi:hypothetical protein
VIFDCDPVASGARDVGATSSHVIGCGDEHVALVSALVEHAHNQAHNFQDDR